MIKEHGTLIGNRYQIFDKLGEGGMGAVYRAKDRLTGEVVALKCLTEPVDKLMFASRDSISRTDVALANEFRTLASLRHPHIINVLDYGFDRNRQPFFTMNLLERPQTIVEYCKNKFEEEKVRLLVEMLQALTYLHRRDILHRDLKPANVLVTNSGQVKVLDFGLSTTSDQAKGTAGTLAYMAPELIRGQPPSQTSDLYAVGMIAYEVFTGSYPFEATNPTLMMMRIIQAIPDFSVINNLSLEVVLMRLLMKDPEDRYPDADTVIMELHNAVGIAPPKENKAVRESFLQAAKFIGRENELAQLTNALHNTMQGQGSMWLVGGESGVGKTRLLDELRTHALVQGSLVLHGQAVEGGGLPYQLWREPMRRLVLSTELNDLEAGVIKAIVPDIGNLLERDVPDAPELTGQAGQQRLLLTIADVFKRQTTPILLLLEDLQWVAQYLEPLKTLNRIASDLRLLVVGNYRNDERPDLPNEIPGANLIRLERFSEKEVAALSHSMLGESGQKTDVLQLLNKETEGNVFFLVEVVRALAEQVGHLREVGRMTLPDQVFSGGIKQIIQRRLDKVPVQLQPLSKLAAVMGREIDPAVLSHIVEAKQVEDWLIACADASVLDIREDRWLFAHDKLREALLADLSAEERSVVHRQVAEAIELAYPGDDIYAVVLAHHWHEAGNDEKERHYAYIAGRRAFDSGTVPEARRFFERALEITREDDVLNYADLLNDLGQAVGYLADYLTATQHLEQSLSLSQ